MSLRAASYRIGKCLVDALPPWLLRVRPFDVYEINLDESTSRPTAASLSRRAGPGEGLQNGAKRASLAPPTDHPLASPCSGENLSSATLGDEAPTDERIAWLVSAEEVAALGALAADVNKAAWDGDSIRAAAVWRQGQPIACCWIARGAYEEPDLRLRFELAEDEAWLFAAAVAPDHRRQGVYRRLGTFVLAELASSGMRRVLLGVTWGNHPSQIAHQGFGAKRVATVAAFQLLGFAASVRRGRIRSRSRLLLGSDRAAGL